MITKLKINQTNQHKYPLDLITLRDLHKTIVMTDGSLDIPGWSQMGQYPIGEWQWLLQLGSADGCADCWVLQFPGTAEGIIRDRDRSGCVLFVDGYRDEFMIVRLLEFRIALWAQVQIPTDLAHVQRQRQGALNTPGTWWQLYVHTKLHLQTRLALTIMIVFHNRS